MAAAEYYNPGGGRPQAPPVQAPRPPQTSMYTPQQSMSSLPYPISDAPPPYSQFADHGRPHSQPPPQSRPENHVAFAPTNNYGPAENGFIPGKHDHRPSLSHPHQSPYQQPVQPQQGYPFPNGLQPPPQYPPRPSAGGEYRPPVKANDEYYYDDDYDSQSRSRDRSNGRRHHRHHHHDRPQEKKKAKNDLSTFVGAGGGALIGDLIFPGLGTLGGALLGGVAGHEHGKQKRSYSSTTGRSKSYQYSSEYDDGGDRRGRRRDY